MSAALGIANSMWWRGRWMLFAGTIYLCLLATGVRWFPQAAPIFCTGTLALGFVWANLLTTLTFGPADFGSRNSGFPSHMLVLPARVKWLVGWPMFYGIVLCVALWCLPVALVLYPANITLPLIWPAVLFAAVTAWTQSLAWMPFPAPIVRAPALVLAVIPIALLIVWGCAHLQDSHVPFVISAIGTIWIVAAYAVGVYGLTRARCGNQPDWFFACWIAMRQKTKSVSCHAEIAPFASASAAQQWYELRRNMLGVPVITAVFLVIFFLLLVYEMMRPDQPHGLLLHSLVIKSELISLGFFVLFPVMVCGIMGAGLGKFDHWGGKEQMTTFFAARPIASLQYVKIKLKAAAWVATMSWCILLIVMSIWALLNISPINHHESFVRVAWNNATPGDIAAAVLGTIAWLLLMWRALVSSMWISLIGRKWVSNVVGVSLTVGMFFVLPCIAGWLYRHPTIGDQILALAPVIATALVALKLCTAAVIGIVLKRLELASGRDLAITFAIWTVTTGIVLLLINLFIPLTAMIAAIVILLVPLARITAAPLALYWNRHR